MLRNVVLVTLLITGCIPVVAQSQPGIEEVRNSWVNSWNSKQLEAVMDLYAAEASLLPASGERIAGKDRIRAHFKSLFDAASTMNIVVTSEAADVIGQVGFDSGSYEETRVMVGARIGGGVRIGGGARIGGGGGKYEIRGQYLVVLKRERGKWLIVQQATTVVPQASPQQ